jgi:hypothetical protein
MLPEIVFAQTGIVKDMIGWALVFLCVLLGALPVINPFGRKARKKS